VIVRLHIIGQLLTNGLEGLIVFIMLISSIGRMVNDPWRQLRQTTDQPQDTSVRQCVEN
jgi:hypothetical protein